MDASVPWAMTAETRRLIFRNCRNGRSPSVFSWTFRADGQFRIPDPRVGVPRHHVTRLELRELVDLGGAAGCFVIVEMGDEPRFSALAGAHVEADDPAFVLVMHGVDVRDDRPWLLFHQFIAELRYSCDVWFL